MICAETSHTLLLAFFPLTDGDHEPQGGLLDAVEDGDAAVSPCLREGKRRTSSTSQGMGFVLLHERAMKLGVRGILGSVHSSSWHYPY